METTHGLRRRQEWDEEDQALLARASRAIEQVEAASTRRALRAYVAWLKEDRGVAGKGIEERLVTARRLLEDWRTGSTSCVQRLRFLTGEDVEATVARLVRRCGSSWAQESLRRGGRSFLLFCASQGWVAKDFPHSLPKLSPGRQRWSPDGHERERALRLLTRLSGSSSRSVLRRYIRWLEDVHELASSTALERVTTATRLVQDWSGGEDRCVRALRRLRVADVEDTFARHGRDAQGKSALRALQGGMRRFLQFCAAQGWVSPELAAAVPPIQSYRLSGLPRGVSDDDLSRLLAALPTSTRAATRDRAILLLLSTYGVRCGQIAALRLTDLDWRGRRITFAAHKRGRTVEHVLSPAVAEALAPYLRQRPAPCTVDRVFLCACRPYVAMSPGAITVMVRNLFKRAGLTGRPCGPHSLRHAFARRLLDARQPFKVISDLLGHRSLESTAIYAKVDRPFLAEMPLEWPEVAR